MSALARDILSRLHHRSVYLNPEFGSISHDLIELSRIGLDVIRTNFEARKLELLSSYGFSQPPSQNKPFAFAAGTAIIPMHGALINRMVWSSSWATGYGFIRGQLQAALADADVERIVFDINSYGGTAAGCSELSAEIHASRAVKPSLAVVDANCYSAAYFCGSSCTEMKATPSGGVGSIGVVAMHVDYSEALADDGIKVTFIHAGKHKVDGNPYEALSDRARTSIQADVDYHYGLFIDAVHRNRGISKTAIRETEADSFNPSEALDLKLIDGVQSPAEALAAFAKPSMERAVMDKDKPETTAAAPALTQEQIAAMIAQGVAQGVRDVLSADKARKAAIKGCEAAKERPKLAAHLAEETDLSAEAATTILQAAAPERKVIAPGAGNDFFVAMNGGQNPNVGADFAAGGETDVDGKPTAASNVQNILGAYTALSGRKITTPGQKAA